MPSRCMRTGRWESITARMFIKRSRLSPIRIRNSPAKTRKLLDETLRDYRRAGLELPPDKRKEVEQLRKELSKLGTDFERNIVDATAPVVFTKAELDGVPEDFFEKPGVKVGADAYTVPFWRTSPGNS